MTSNLLPFAARFIEETVQFCTEAYKKTWSAENRVYYNSRLESIISNGSTRDIIITVKPSFVRDFSGKEKCFIYEVLRLASIEFPPIKYILEDLRQLLKRRGYQNDRYFYLESLTDNMFAYELDEKLTEGYQSRRIYYRKLNSKFGRRKKFTLQEIFSEYFFTDFIEVNRPRPKRKIRHKGYRDHGSLGSEFSKTLKQQSCDYSILEAEKQRKKREEDFRKFLLGCNGWM